QAAPAFFERLAQINTRTAQRRGQSEENACEQSGDEGEGQHAAIYANILQARDVARIEKPQPVKAPDGHHHAERAAKYPKHHAFGQKLAHYAPAISTKGCANRYLLFTYCRARKQQICDVGARYEQYATDRAKQDKQRRANVADYLFEQWPDAVTEAAAGRIG